MDAPVLAVPLGVVRLEVLDEQACRGDVVTVHDYAVGADVVVPASVLPVNPSTPWSASPHPGVVDEHVVGVHLESVSALPT